MLVSVEHPRVLLMAWDGSGLGHANRSAIVARALLARGCDVLLLSGADRRFLATTGIPTLLLPELYRDGPGWELVPGLSHVLLRALLEEWRPTVVVHDAFVCAPLVRPTVGQVLLYRPNLKYTADATELSSMDSVLVVEDRRVLPPDALPKVIQDRSHYVGPIVRVAPDRDVGRSVRMRHGIEPSEKLVVLCAGGGGFDEIPAMFDASVEAIGGVDVAGLRLVVVTGPHFAGAVSLPAHYPHRVTVVAFEPDMVALFAAADLVIGQAGYNTAHELALTGTPAILIPGPRQADDQAMRARRLSHERPWLRVAPVSVADIRREAAALLALGQQSTTVVASNGAALVAEHLLKLVRESPWKRRNSVAPA